MTPRDVASLTAEELASFVQQRKDRLFSDRKFLAQIAYTSGCLGSMSLTRDRPSFESVFPSFKEGYSSTDVERSKQEMLAFAEYLNREARRRDKVAGIK